MVRSLYFNWLRGLDKGLLMPELVFLKTENCGGYYMRPHPGETLEMVDRTVALDRGLVAINPVGLDNDEAHILAHEWRHHWQRFNRPHPPSKYMDQSLSYPDAIRKFFRQPHELDALLFAHRLAPTETSHKWIDMLHKDGCNAKIVQMGH